MISRSITSALFAGILGVCLLTAGARAQEPGALRPSPHALPAIQAPAIVAQDASCASLCQARHDQCRVRTKGSAACDTERQRCLQACLASKKRN